MYIALYYGMPLAKQMDGYQYFVLRMIKLLADRHPMHHFFLINAKDALPSQSIIAPNIEYISIAPPPDNPFLRKYWYKIFLASKLKKLKPNLFVSFNGAGLFSQKIPQCVVVPELSFLYSPQAAKKSHQNFYKQHTPVFVRQASAVVALSNTIKLLLEKEYPFAAKKISLLVPVPDSAYSAASIEEKIKVKEEYTEGREYFFCNSQYLSQSDLLTVLKSFSLFKKRQRSNFKLVITIPPSAASFIPKINTYKYREDVVQVLVTADSNIPQLMASAYALLHISSIDTMGFAVADAMACGLPIIATDINQFQEIATDAALYANVNDHNAIAEKMMMLYKDEGLKNKLGEKGIRHTHSIGAAVDSLWLAIEKTIS